jgi:hypothetical protein
MIDVVRKRRDLMRDQRNAGNGKKRHKERKDRKRSPARLAAGIYTQGPVHRVTQSQT